MTPRGLDEPTRADWHVLARPTADPKPFDPAAVAHLPDPVQRWLTHAIRPGTPLRTAVEVRMRGEIRLGAWRRFTAVQRITPDGFVWAATARLLGLPVIGFDRFTRGSGQMRWRLLNAIPVMRAGGADVTRSAVGRHAGELLLYAPAAALDPAIRWRAIDETSAVATVGAQEITVTHNAAGALTALRMPRWGNPGNQAFGEHTFSATMEGELAFDGFRIPHVISAGWPDGPFIRYAVLAASAR